MNDYPNETVRLLHERGSVRNFLPRDVDESDLAWVLGAATRSASGGNLQPYCLVVVREQAMREKFAELCGQSFIARAPVNLVFCIDMRRNAVIAERARAPYTAPKAFRHFWIAYQDVMIAAQSACLAADALGLGSCYIGTIVEHIGAIAGLLGLPAGVLPVELLVLGWPVEPPRQRGKFPAGLMVHRERYAEPDADELYAAYQSREQGWNMGLTPEAVERFRASCRAAGGEEFAAACVADAEERGAFNAAQYRFGLKYPADEMPRGNAGFLAAICERGFPVFGEEETAR